MSKLIKWVLGLFAALVAVVVSGIVVITVFIDPNSFKPDIEKVANKQGIALTLGGDLAWQFYPNLGIVVQQVALAPLAQPQAVIASVQEAALSVQLMPLFSGSVAVNGLLLDGLDAKLAVDAEGKGNWEALLTGDAAKDDKKDEEEQQGKFSLAVHQLSIKNSQVSYADAQSQQTIALKNFALEGTDIELNNQPFALQTSGEFVMEDAEKSARTGKFDVDGSIAVPEDMSAVTIKHANVSAELAGKDVQQAVKGTLQLAAKLPGDKQALAVDLLELGDAEVSSNDTVAQQKILVSGLTLKATGITLDEKSSPSVMALDLSANSANMNNAVSKQNLTVNGLLLTAQNIAFNAQPFPFSVKGTLKAEQPDMPAISTGFDFAGSIGMDEAMNAITLDKARLLATLQGEAAQSFDLQASMNVVLEPFAYHGDVRLAPVNGRKAMAAIGQALPETQSPTAFAKVGFSAAVAGSDNAVKASDLNLLLDASTFTGSVAVTDIEKQALVVKLRGDQLNADDYMAPTVEAAPGAVAPAATGDEPLIPMETLRPLNMDVDLVIGSLTLNKLLFRQLTALVSAHNGVVNIRQFSGNLYDSPMQLTANVDASGDKAVIDFDASSKQLPVGQLLRDLEIEEHFSGTSDVVAKGKTRGVSKNELMQNLDAVVDMTGKQMQVAEVNVEKAVCEFIAQVEGKPMSAVAWENFTKLRDMTTRVIIKNGVANVQKLDAGVEEIELSTNGKFNFIKGDFDFHLTTRLVEALMDGVSCKVSDKKLLNRDIPIRCKGNLDDIGLKTCLPDMSVLEDFLKDTAKARLQEETDVAKARAQAEVDQAKAKAQAEADAAKAKAKDEVDKALKEKMNEEGGKAAKDLLKGLLKK